MGKDIVYILLAIAVLAVIVIPTMAGECSSLTEIAVHNLANTICGE